MSHLSPRARTALAIAVALATLGLAIVLREQVREIVVLPMVRFAWLLGLYLRIVPQWVLWGVFLTVALFIAIGSVLRPEISGERRRREAPMEHPGPIETEMRWIRLAARGSYGRWRLAQRLAELMAQAEAHRTRTPLARVKRQLAQGDWQAPDEIVSYVQAGLSPPPSRTTWLALSQMGRQRAPRLTPNADPERVIAYIQEEIEGNHAD
jgi:hypothetical protein